MNLQFTDLFLLFALAAGAGLFWQGRHVHEIALRLTRRHCEREEVLLLDETVSLKQLRLRRDTNGRLRLSRLYTFEFTVTGGERYSGETRVIGGQVTHVSLPPHRFFRDPDQLH